MEKKEVPAISVAILHLVGAVMVGLFFWVLFVVLIFWAALIRALQWLADLSTENLARLTVRADSLANTAWARSHLVEGLSAFRAVAWDRKSSEWATVSVSVIHATRQLWAEHRLFRA